MTGYSRQFQKGENTTEVYRPRVQSVLKYSLQAAEQPEPKPTPELPEEVVAEILAYNSAMDE